MSYDGLLNSTCIIEHLVVTQNATTRQKVEAWTTKYSGVKCRLDGATNSEYFGYLKEMTKATHTLFIENKYTLNMYTNRIKKDGITYNILQITDGGGHGHHFELALEQKQ